MVTAFKSSQLLLAQACDCLFHQIWSAAQLHWMLLLWVMVAFQVTSACCLFLAGKVEETPKKCKDIIKTTRVPCWPRHSSWCLGRIPRWNATVLHCDTWAWVSTKNRSVYFWVLVILHTDRALAWKKLWLPFTGLQEELMTLERILLQTMKFDLQVEHPYAYLLKFAKIIKGIDAQFGGAWGSLAVWPRFAILPSLCAAVWLHVWWLAPVFQLEHWKKQLEWKEQRGMQASSFAFQGDKGQDPKDGADGLDFHQWQVKSPGNSCTKYVATVNAPGGRCFLAQAWHMPHIHLTMHIIHPKPLPFPACSLCTMLCLQWEPDIIAVALIYLAGRLTKYEISDWNGKQHGQRVKWYEFLVEDVTLELLEGMCSCETKQCLAFAVWWHESVLVLWLIRLVFCYCRSRYLPPGPRSVLASPAEEGRLSTASSPSKTNPVAGRLTHTDAAFHDTGYKETEIREFIAWALIYLQAVHCCLKRH